MILGIGCDLCSIDRLHRAMENPHFTERVFTPREQQLLSAKGKGRFQTAAGLWAAKEAALKALGIGLVGGVALTDLEITEDELGAPHLDLLNAAHIFTENKGGNALYISISHEGDNALAFAVWEG